MFENFKEFLVHTQKTIKSPYLNYTKEEVLKLMESETKEFRYLPQKFKTDLEIIKYSIPRYPYLYCYLNKDLKDNFKITQLAVGHNGYMINFASPRLQKDRTLCLLSVQNCETAFLYIDKKYRKDLEFAYEAVKYSEQSYEYLDQTLKKDPSLIKFMLKTHKNSFKELLNSEMSNEEYIYLAVFHDGYSINYLNKKYKEKLHFTQKHLNLETIQQAAKFLLDQLFSEQEKNDLQQEIKQSISVQNFKKQKL